MIENKYIGFIDRIGKRPEGHSDEDLSCQYITICESGWDITPRWGFETETEQGLNDGIGGQAVGNMFLFDLPVWKY